MGYKKAAPEGAVLVHTLECRVSLSSWSVSPRGSVLRRSRYLRTTPLCESSLLARTCAKVT